MEDIDVIHTEPLVTQEFSDMEKAKFESAWRSIVRFYGSLGVVRRADDGLKNAVLGLAQDSKKRFGGTEFEGLTPKTGFGMQPIHIRDVNHTNIHDWATSIWTAGWREWLGNVGPNGGAAGATFVVPRDIGDDFWQVAAFGVLTNELDPTFRMIRVVDTKKEIGDHDVRGQFQSSQDGYADFGRIYYHMGKPLHNFGYGVRAQVTTIAAQHLQLVGVTFGTAQRFYQTGANDRLVAETG